MLLEKLPEGEEDSSFADNVELEASVVADTSIEIRVQKRIEGITV